MKKLLVILAIGAFAACNNSADSTATTDSAAAATDSAATSTVDTAAATTVDTSAVKADTAKVDTLKK